jgi:hypothetical protein
MGEGKSLSMRRGVPLEISLIDKKDRYGEKAYSSERTHQLKKIGGISRIEPGHGIRCAE